MIKRMRLKYGLFVVFLILFVTSSKTHGIDLISPILNTPPLKEWPHVWNDKRLGWIKKYPEEYESYLQTLKNPKEKIEAYLKNYSTSRNSFFSKHATLNLILIPVLVSPPNEPKHSVELLLKNLNDVMAWIKTEGIKHTVKTAIIGPESLGQTSHEIIFEGTSIPAFFIGENTGLIAVNVKKLIEQEPDCGPTHQFMGLTHKKKILKEEFGLIIFVNQKSKSLLKPTLRRIPNESISFSSQGNTTTTLPVYSLDLDGDKSLDLIYTFKTKHSGLPFEYFFSCFSRDSKWHFMDAERAWLDSC